VEESHKIGLDLGGHDTNYSNLLDKLYLLVEITWLFCYDGSRKDSLNIYQTPSSCQGVFIEQCQLVIGIFFSYSRLDTRNCIEIWGKHE
jgi:hypothetical protein